MSALSLRLLPVQIGVMLSLLCVPLWLRMPYAPTTYDPMYGFGFLLTLPMLATVLAWVLAGVPGLRDLWRDRLRLAWVLALIALGAWMHLSVSWSFIGAERGLFNVGQSAAIRFTLVVAWVMAAACAGPPPRVTAAALVIAACAHTLIGVLQVAQQGSIGLAALGEFDLDPARSGVSVLEAGGERWLRPYGLLPHPNPYGGFLMVGLLAALGFVFAEDRRLRLPATAAAGWILYGLLLSFSRGAWLGFAAGAVMALPLLLRFALRNRAAWGRFAAALGLMLVVGAGFAAAYSPLILARTGAGTEGVEVRSLTDRLIFTLFAYRAATDSPQNTLLGVGAGNFPWRAAYYLAETEYDLRGDNVHHVYLSALAETGLVGLALLTAAVVLGVEGVLRRVKVGVSPSPPGPVSLKGRGGDRRRLAVAGASHERTHRLALLAGFTALATVALFDHYPWTLLHFQALWWGLLALAGREKLW